MTGADVVFYFGDSYDRGSGYQLSQWLQPLERLQKRHSVRIFLGDAGFKQVIPPSSSLPVDVYGDARALAKLFATHQPAVVLYPNQYYRNHKALSFSRAIHVFVSHGESDKQYMSERGLTVFDVLFLAGEVAKGRVARDIPAFPEERIRLIGRPQLLDTVEQPENIPTTNRPRTVLYAPTWEGGKPHNRYGSVVSHGEAMVTEILADPNLRLIYRPHPFTGRIVPEWGAVNRRIIRAVRSANKAHPGAGHFFDESQFGWQLDFADVMIADVSAVTYDWLATGKPLILTRPAEKEAVVAREGFLAELDLLDADRALDIRRLIADACESPELTALVAKWSKKYYSPTVGEDTGDEVFVTEVSSLVSRAREHYPVTGASVPSPSTDGSEDGTGSFVVEKLRMIRRRTLQIIRRAIPQRFRSAVVGVLNDRTQRLSDQIHGAGNPILLVTGWGADPLAVAPAREFFDGSGGRFSGPPMIAATSVHSFLSLWFRARLGRLGAVSASQVLYARRVEIIKYIIDAIRPSHLFYNQIVPVNHFAFRVFNTTHVLFLPERFEKNPTHNLLPYDLVISNSTKYTNRAQSHVFWFSGGNIVTSEDFLAGH